MPYDWKTKVVFLTGASSGIGRALALELGRRGAAAGLLARRAEELIKLAEEVERAGGRALALPADVRDAAAVEGAAARVREHWGRVDVLVANAGMSTTTSGTDLRADEANNVISINVLGAVNCVAAVLPDMLRRGDGHLVAVTTIHPGFIRTPMTAGRKTKLPFLLEVDDAARRILRAVEQRRRTYAFPWQLATVVRLMRHLPDPIYDRLASRRSFRD